MTSACECPAENPDCQHPTCPRWPQEGHLEKPYAGPYRRLPLWLIGLDPRVLRVRFCDWLWLRRHRRGDFGDYVVELGGQRFTQAQWEAVQTMIDGPPCTCPDPEIAERSGHVAACGATR